MPTGSQFKLCLSVFPTWAEVSVNLTFFFFSQSRDASLFAKSEAVKWKLPLNIPSLVLQHLLIQYSAKIFYQSTTFWNLYKQCEFSFVLLLEIWRKSQLTDLQFMAFSRRKTAFGKIQFGCSLPVSDFCFVLTFVFLLMVTIYFPNFSFSPGVSC